MNTMNLQKDNVIGIVGGMGPEAGLTLFNYILSHTGARTDQEHLSVILMSLPRHIADRTSFLEGSASINPAYAIAGIIGSLERSGAKTIGIACNTSHVPGIYDTLLEELEKTNSRVKLVNMPVETCRHIKDHHPHVRRVGLMTTNGTYASRIYEKLLRIWGYEVVVPDPGFQHSVIHKMIYDPGCGIKANAGLLTAEADLLMEQAIRFFTEKKAEAIILGCTELSRFVGLGNQKDLLMIDSTEALALALISEASTRARDLPEKAAACR
jgi:aspartate racemase